MQSRPSRNRECKPGTASWKLGWTGMSQLSNGPGVSSGLNQSSCREGWWGKRLLSLPSSPDNQLTRLQPPAQAGSPLIYSAHPCSVDKEPGGQWTVGQSSPLAHIRGICLRLSPSTAPSSSSPTAAPLYHTLHRAQAATASKLQIYYSFNCLQRTHGPSESTLPAPKPPHEGLRELCM